MSRRHVWAGTLLVLAACEGGIPLPKLPQVQQASEVVQGGRLRSHQTCSKTAGSVAALIDCMAGFGYEFIPRGNGYPAAECWDLRDGRADGRLPPQYCFLRAHPGGAAPER